MTGIIFLKRVPQRKLGIMAATGAQDLSEVRVGFDVHDLNRPPKPIELILLIFVAPIEIASPQRHSRRTLREPTPDALGAI